MLRSAPEPGGNTIKDGDLLIVYERWDSLKSIRVDATKQMSNRYGHFRMSVSFCGLHCCAQAGLSDAE